MKHEHEVKVPEDAVKVDVTMKVDEDVKTGITQVKQHLQENKTTYLVGAGCFVAGYLLRKQPHVTTIVNHVTPLIINGGDIPAS